MYLYEEFSDETKKFLNKAMDIYSTIKDREIQIIKKEIFEYKNISLKKQDKKIFSLFMAGFLSNSSLKDLLDEYDEIKVNDLFSFIKLEENDIKPLSDNEYNEFYDKNFKITLTSILDKETLYIINEVTPEVIFYLIEYSHDIDSEIIDDFCDKYINKSICYHHPSFEAACLAAKANGAIKEKPRKNDNINITPEDIFTSIFNSPIEKPAMERKKSTSSITLEDEKIWSILDEIQKKFIGQEVATEYLFYNIVNNQQLALRDDVNDGERSIIFLDGPTGTGKTAITREITEKLDIPFSATSIVNYSATGYVGGDITDTLKDLYKKANGDLEKAQRGIIVFDEFDKIAYKREGSIGLTMKQAVQQQLLDFMGGGKYTIDGGEGFSDSRRIEFDTSKLTFVCLAALTDLRKSKTEKKAPIGFGPSEELVDTDAYNITPNDLINIGLGKELVGRLNTYLHTDEYSKETLLKILKESPISPLISFEKWITSKGKKLQIDEGVDEIIANAAYETNTGARSLQTVMNSIRTPFIREVLRGTDEVIHLEQDNVLKIIENTTSRKGRK